MTLALKSDVQPRLGPLDALRGIAALMVMLVHLYWICREDVFNLSLGVVKIIGFGASGVILFFVISGFSLDLTMTKHNRSPNPTLSYAMSRFFRIAPLFYLMIPITFFGYRFLVETYSISLKTLLANIFFIFNIIPGQQNGIVWASWTIGVEAIFYMLFPLFHRMPIWVSGLITLIPYALLALVFPDSVFGSFSWIFFAGFLPLFITGMGAHRLYRRLSAAPMPGGSAVFLLACAVLMVFSTVQDSSVNIFLRLPIAIAYAALVVGALLWNPRILANRITAFYGSLSYAIYLLQFPVLFAMRPVYRALLGDLPPGAAYLAAIPLTLAVLTPLAALAHFGVERPFEDLRRRIQFRLSSVNST